MVSVLQLSAEVIVQATGMSSLDSVRGRGELIFFQVYVVQWHLPTNVRVIIQYYELCQMTIVDFFTDLSLAWQRIRTGILGFLEDQRQEARRYVIIRGYRDRIQRVVAAIEKVIKTIPQPRLTPPYGYFVRSQEFSSIIRDDTLETNTFDMRLQDLMSLVPDMITSWVTVSTGKLLELLDSNGETNLPLELACTFFKCRWCNDPITYPRILMHSCLRDKPRKPVGDEKDETEAARDENEDEEDEEDDEEETDELSGDVDNLQTQLDRLQNTPDRVWSQLLSWYDAADWNEDNDQVFADDEATGFAKAIVTVCGEDPAVASISRMENIDSRLECLRCCRLYKSKPPKRLIMNWKMAVRPSFSWTADVIRTNQADRFCTT